MIGRQTSVMRALRRSGGRLVTKPMGEHAVVPCLREGLLFLALAGIFIALLERIRINPVLAFTLFGGGLIG